MSSMCRAVAELCQVGVSDASYASTKGVQLHGNGQVSHSDLYFHNDLMKGYREGMPFQDVLQADQLVVSMISFIEPRNDFNSQVYYRRRAARTQPCHCRALPNGGPNYCRRKLPKCYLARCCISSVGEPEFRPSPGEDRHIRMGIQSKFNSLKCRNITKFLEATLSAKPKRL